MPSNKTMLITAVALVVLFLLWKKMNSGSSSPVSSPVYTPSA